jgi:hypothetical protein
MKRILYLFLLIPAVSFAQQKQPSSAVIEQRLQKLNFLGSAMMVAAHPDDENTQLITWLANDRLATTAYFAMTRGDGGQNLIGPEIRDELGLIRTQELLAARKIDGGQQFFTRANDFGFSKVASETFEIWDKDAILSDVVRVIRQFKPDVVINRFPPTERAGHGHHQGSAILSIEAYDLVGKADVYPKTATEYGVWQPKRLFVNGFGGQRGGGPGGPPPGGAPGGPGPGGPPQGVQQPTPAGVIRLNTGGYNPLLGASYGEISALSRSQHKTQGFGSVGSRGDQFDTFELIKGEPAQKDLFDGVNTTWSRVKGGEKVQPLVDKAIKEFNYLNPSATVPTLVQIYKEIGNVEPGVWKDRKLVETARLIQDCLGLYAELSTDLSWAAPGDRVSTQVEIINRSPIEVVFSGIKSTDIAMDTTFSRVLKNGEVFRVRAVKALSASKNYSDPYWLSEPHSQGVFTVKDESKIGTPENAPAVNFVLKLTIAGQPIEISRPLVSKARDRVDGEVTNPFEIVPAVFVNVAEPVMVFKDALPKPVAIILKSASEKTLHGDLKLQLPAGWRSEPGSIPFDLAARGNEQAAQFMVFPSSGESTGVLKAVATVGTMNYDQSLERIIYPHIPNQLLLPKAESKLVRLNLKKEGNVVGYIAGAGDEIPAALRNMGYEVWQMKDEEVTAENLKKVDAVVLGVRAINTNERLLFQAPILLDYVKNGGTMVVQYNTTTNVKAFSPFELVLSADRVTEENAEVRILKPEHPLLGYPNKIVAADFEGWVQERGLYYPNKWGPEFEALFSMNDKNETPKDGSLLVAKYGSGQYIYTGISFFRELPQGVPGAYKLFANIVSAGKTAKPTSTNVKSKK